MILRRIQVEGWGCFANRVEIGPFDEGISILSSSNGTGKSTLSKILTRGLIENFSVGGTEAQSLRPWGRALTPKVTIEFSHGGVEYRVRKRFLDKPSGQLDRRESTGWVRIAEDEAADRQVRDLLRADAPGGGLSNPKHWGVLQVLWAPQDLQSLPPLSGNVLSDIRSSMGFHILSAGAEKLVGSVASAYLQSFTPTGRLRSGANEAPVLRLRREQSTAESGTKRAQEVVTALESGRNRIKDLQSRYDVHRNHADQILADVKEARIVAAEYSAQVSKKTEKEQRRRAAQADHARIKQNLDAIKECIEAVAIAERDLATTEQNLPRALETVEASSRNHSLAEAKLEDALANQVAAWETNELARLAGRFVDLANFQKDVQRRLLEAQGTASEIERLGQQMAALRAPTREQLLSIRNQVRTRDEAKVRFEASLIALEIEPIAETPVLVTYGDQPGSILAPAGRSTRVAGSPTVEVEITGFGKVRATGPTGSAVEYRRQFEQADGRLKQLTSPFGTDDAGHLEEHWTESVALMKELQSAQARLDNLLSGQSVNALELEQIRVSKELEEILRQQPGWVESQPDVGLIEEGARYAQKSAEQLVRTARETVNSAQLASNKATAERLDLEKRRDQCTADIQQGARRLSLLQTDGKTNAQKEQELAEAALEWDAQRSGIEKLDEALAAYVTNPTVKLAALESESEAAIRERDSARDQLRDQEALVRQLSSSAPYSTLAEAAEKLEAIRLELGNEEVRTAALKVLYETTEQSRSEAYASIPEQVAETANSILRRILGTNFGTISLSENLAVSGLEPGSTSLKVPVCELSGGEKEQVAFAVRLALAKQLARSERQLLVLDDSLGATDSARFGRILELLNESASELQILILTCHPERYASLGGVSFYDFERLLHTQASTAA